MTYVGINIGSISANIVVLTDKLTILKQNHYGQPKSTLDNLLSQLDLNGAHYGVSGSLGDITETQAIERALAEQSEQFDAIASLGGESFVLYTLKDNHIQNVLSHDKCAAGSGEFFIQQLQRLNLGLDEAIERAKHGSSIQIASRCSVHCKSDITHKLNKGEASVEDILYSVLESSANKIIALLNQGKQKIHRMLLIGGSAKNSVLVDILRQKLPNVEVVVTEESAVFEAYGTALLVKDHPMHTTLKLLFHPSFSSLPALAKYGDAVKIFHAQVEQIGKRVAPFILGVDVGSTTTKAVVIDPADNAVLASHYGRTNGNPVQATRECLNEIHKQFGDRMISLVGVTGSGREIVGAYLGTAGVYNEISAHATGAAYFDHEVDTIFEIGGQDAKYVLLQNGVPIDYAMNAACSAGTGSFLEESCKSDLGINTYDIADVALQASNPVKFKADCAAFINSDIRTALQEGYDRSDIIGGLVYSIVHNYLNKVMGTREVGKKIFLQGGVAKNRAVGYAFAQATGKTIIIPPNPELIGAFGVALMVKERYAQAKVAALDKYIPDFIATPLVHLGSFTCHACTNYCTIERYEVNGRKFPFGGRCSRYEHVWKRREKTQEARDLVGERSELLFAEISNTTTQQQTVGIPRALLTHSLYPLYATFFAALGYNIQLSTIDEDMDLIINAPFCYPIQIAHGAVLNLVKQNVDYIFLPHVNRMPGSTKWRNSTLCPMTQGSPYFISPHFPEQQFLEPVLDFANGYENSTALLDLATDMLHIDEKIAATAYQQAVHAQLQFEQEHRRRGAQELQAAIESGETAIILAGRSYNAFPPESSQSIAKKLISRGIRVIPFDALEPPTHGDTAWYFPNLNIQAAEYAQKYENIFLLYITNYSCNVDAFVQRSIRAKLQSKPYLILELDAHSGDAGTQTRLEAFLEIIQNYRKSIQKTVEQFTACRILEDGTVLTSYGESVNIRDPRVKIYFPPFSKYHTDAFATGFQWFGFHTQKSPDINLDLVTKGLQYTSGKECIPLPIIIGHILELVEHREPGDIIGYYVLKGGAPCVVDAYFDYVQRFIEDNQLEDVFLFELSPYSSFFGVKPYNLFREIAQLLIIGDIVNEIENAVRVVGPANGKEQLLQYWNQFLLQIQDKNQLSTAVDQFIEQIQSIPRSKNPRTLPKAIVTGDFYVRFSNFFLNEIKQRYADNEILIKSADLNELLLYTFYDPVMSVAQGWNFNSNGIISVAKALLHIRNRDPQLFLALSLAIKYVNHQENRLRDKFEQTGFLFDQGTNIREIYENAAQHIDPIIYGEAITAIGKAQEALNGKYNGIVLIGPYNCLPYKISQSILKPLAFEQNVPLVIYDADITPTPPAFVRLIDASIQQIKFKEQRVFLKLV